MTRLQRFFTSSIGLKVIMALTGICLILFVLIHMIGNLQMFVGVNEMNGYAAFLKSMPGPLWAARAGLIALILIHIASALRLSKRNIDARPQAYEAKSTVKATLSSRTMIFSGTFLLLFIVIHLLHFTVGTVLPENFHMTDPSGRHNVYAMVVLGFQNRPMAIFYIAAMLMLMPHLSHGISSLFQTVGFNHPQYNRVVKVFGAVLAVIIVFGFISVPLGVLLNVIQLPI